MAISLRLNIAVERELDKYARLEGRSKSELIRSLIADFVGTRSKRPTSWELGKHLFGRHGSGRSDLSVNRKSILREKLHAKKNRH